MCVTNSKIFSNKNAKYTTVHEIQCRPQKNQMYTKKKTLTYDTKIG